MFITLNVWLANNIGAYYTNEPYDYVLHQITLDVTEALDTEEFFCIANGHPEQGTPAQQGFNNLSYYDSCKRSFSVGDAVSLNTNGPNMIIFRALPMGWEEITPDHKDYAQFTTARLHNESDFS